MPEPVRFQHYEVARREDGSLDELGRGAMGVTYRAFDTNLQCYVALKVISSVYLESDIARQRFLREARAAAALRHPNVAVVFHLGEEGGDCFYAMEFVEGETLEEHMKRGGTIPVAEALEITLQVARALGAAEKQGLVHRDLKPANLMITTEDDESINVKVIDFGLAKNAAGGGNDDAATVTLAGFLGTPQFASPEQLEEREIDIRSDIYSLGITLFYMLAGRAPFGGSIAQVMSQHLQREPPLEVLAGVPASVVALLRRMLAKDPSERQQTAADLRAEVEACLATVGPVLRPSAPTQVPAGDFETQSLETLVNAEVVAAPPSRRPVGIAVLAILILVLAGAFAIWRGLENPPTPVTSTSTPSPTPTPDPISQGLAEADRLAASDPVAGLATLLELRKSNPARGELTERIDSAISALRKSPPPSEQARALIPLLGPLAAEGSVGAQVLLGEQVQESDPSRALSLFVSAAGQGNVDAMLLAGDMLGDGRGVSAPDLAGAAVWFRKAAEAGDPRGEYLFAECQLRGKGVKKDEASAVELLTEASTKNEPRAMNLLGSVFQKGLPGVLLPDPGEAFRLFSSAKDEGLLDAQGNLGILYLNGEGVAKNDRVALDLFRDGAEKGNPLCMYFFALCLEKGLGLSPDSAAAQGWYSRAAEAGSKPAQEWCRTNGVGWGSQSPKRP